MLTCSLFSLFFSFFFFPVQLKDIGSFLDTSVELKCCGAKVKFLDCVPNLQHCPKCSALIRLSWCFGKWLCSLASSRSTETIRDGEPRTAGLPFTQLLSSACPCKVTSTETKRLIRDGGGGTEVGGKGDHIPIATLSPPE